MADRNLPATNPYPRNYRHLVASVSKEAGMGALADHFV